ncbi:MAG: A/G-specific adenine glycosylase [Candidatus Kaiserbacteria bacterium]|nr:A/G-specific adenine glycosylase [Candidatus Kaiserbacteria bacterium]
MVLKEFRIIVWRHYHARGRHDLPWRKNHDVYRILVSEVMLQQTQVERVIPFYNAFLKKFPTARRLAAAPLSEVLKSWQGLGYNRRAKLLHAAAKELAITKVSSATELERLPGVGPYTARAVVAFAYNQDVVVIETNIRTAVTHHFFSDKKKVSDVEIEKILAEALPKGRSREWYSALMDYGAHLKRSGISLNKKSATYAKQSKFVGSLRESRGAILRLLSKEVASQASIMKLFDVSRRVQLLEALEALRREQLIQKKGTMYSLAE